MDAKQACPTNLYVNKLAITGACGAGSIATWALAWLFFHFISKYHFQALAEQQLEVGPQEEQVAPERRASGEMKASKWLMRVGPQRQVASTKKQVAPTGARSATVLN